MTWSPSMRSPSGSNHAIEAFNQTNPWAANAVMASFLLPVTIVMQLGTGGTPSIGYHRHRHLDGVPGYYRSLSNNEAHASALPTAGDEIDRVLTVLKLPVTGLAKHLGVSRVAIYDWRSGKPISTANAAKLENFSKAVDVLTSANIQMSSLIRGRKLPGGLTLLESLSNGLDGEQSARTLVQMLRDEAARRKTLTARLSGRQITDTEGTHDAPAVFND